MSAEDDAADREFDILMALNDIVVPPEFLTGARAGYRELKRHARMLRQPRAADIEPANTFSVNAILRGNAER